MNFGIIMCSQNIFIIYIKANGIYKDIDEDVETKFETSNYYLERSLLNGKNKKVVGLMKDELDGNIMREFVELRTKTYSY